MACFLQAHCNDFKLALLFVASVLRLTFLLTTTQILPWLLSWRDLSSSERTPTMKCSLRVSWSKAGWIFSLADTDGLQFTDTSLQGLPGFVELKLCVWNVHLVLFVSWRTTVVWQVLSGDGSLACALPLTRCRERLWGMEGSNWRSEWILWRPCDSRGAIPLTGCASCICT